MKLYITRLLLIGALLLAVHYVLFLLSDDQVHFAWGKETAKALLFALVYTLLFRRNLWQRRGSKTGSGGTEQG